MLPSIFSENLFDDFFNSAMFPKAEHELYGKHAKNLMNTDVREVENGYEIDMNLPGFKKDEVEIQLQDGCLTVSAAKGLDKDEEDKKGRCIRQERYAGSLSRSFYVGEDVEPQDVKAKYENGVLKLFVPKAEVKQVPAQTAIAIELTNGRGRKDGSGRFLLTAVLRRISVRFPGGDTKQDRMDRREESWIPLFFLRRHDV